MISTEYSLSTWRKQPMRLAGILLACLGFVVLAPDRAAVSAEAGAAIEPIVEVEEDVYTYTPADNGAGPMWCAGSTCLRCLSGPG